MTGLSVFHVMAKADVDFRAASGEWERAGQRDPHLQHWTVLPLGPLHRLNCDLETLEKAFADFAHEPLALRLDRVEGMERKANHRSGIVALNCTRVPARVGKLRKALIAAFERAGVELLVRPKPPHVTLNYTWNGGSFREPIRPIVWNVHELLLIESLHGQATHVVRGRCALRAAQDSFFPHWGSVALPREAAGNPVSPA